MKIPLEKVRSLKLCIKACLYNKPGMKPLTPQIFVSLRENDLMIYESNRQIIILKSELQNLTNIISQASEQLVITSNPQFFVSFFAVFKSLRSSTQRLIFKSMEENTSAFGCFVDQLFEVLNLPRDDELAEDIREEIEANKILIPLISDTFY